MEVRISRNGERVPEAEDAFRRAYENDIDRIVSIALGANWRPIETAPKDGSRFLGWWKNFGASIVHRNDPGGEAHNPKNHRECWVDDGGYPFSGKHLTHWMPLPSAPLSD